MISHEVKQGPITATSAHYALVISDKTFKHELTHPTAKPSIILNNLDQILISQKSTGMYINKKGVIKYPKEGYIIEKIESENFYLSFLNDVKGKIYYKNGAIYEGTIFHETRNLTGKMKYANGEVYEGEWELGIRHGYGKHRWTNGDFYDGEWRMGGINGKGVMVLATGERLEGIWEGGVLVEREGCEGV